YTDLPPTPPYTLSLHDALPISADVDCVVFAERKLRRSFSGQLRLHQSVRSTDPRSWDWQCADIRRGPVCNATVGKARPARQARQDRKSTRLNSSHVSISYAVFC